MLVTELTRLHAGALVYPDGHAVGMRVPIGGSNCAKCEFVRAGGTECANENFQYWNGSERLPAPAAEYDCDFFHADTIAELIR